MAQETLFRPSWSVCSSLPRASNHRQVFSPTQQRVFGENGSFQPQPQGWSVSSHSQVEAQEWHPRLEGHGKEKWGPDDCLYHDFWHELTCKVNPLTTTSLVLFVVFFCLCSVVTVSKSGSWCCFNIISSDLCLEWMSLPPSFCSQWSSWQVWPHPWRDRNDCYTVL